MSTANIALAGMNRIEGEVQRSAQRIAGSGRPADGGDSVDLSAEILALIHARNNYAALTDVARADDETTRHRIDLRG